MSSPLTLLGAVGPMGLLCAALATLAAYGLAGTPPVRPAEGRDPPNGGQANWLLRLARGRPDASPLGRRLLVSSIASAALGLLAVRLALGPGVLVWVAAL